MIGRMFEGWHLIIILIIVLVLFGRGKVSEFMGDFAKGIKSFKKGLKEDENENLSDKNRASLSEKQSDLASSVNRQQDGNPESNQHDSSANNKSA